MKGFAIDGRKASAGVGLGPCDHDSLLPHMEDDEHHHGELPLEAEASF